MGTIDGFTIIVYADWYLLTRATGEEKPIPAGTVILTGPQIEGGAHGAKDEEAGYRPRRTPLSPGSRRTRACFTCSPSPAPLAYPSCPNGTLRAPPCYNATAGPPGWRAFSSEDQDPRRSFPTLPLEDW